MNETPRSIKSYSSNSSDDRRR